MKIAEGIRQFVSDNTQYSLYEGYSGRGMFGKKCLGVVVRNGDSFMAFLIALTKYLDEQDIEDTDCDLESASYDDLGKDTIVYFPRIGG